MENVYVLIINGLVKGGYTEKEAEELISKFVEEQKQLSLSISRTSKFYLYIF